MPAVQHAPVASPPLVRLREAVEATRAKGITVKIGPLGILPVSAGGRIQWERDPAASSVSPIGAAVLAAQPPPVDDLAAAALAIGCNLAALEGICDGLQGDEPVSCWAATPARDAYVEGYGIGAQLRVDLLAPAGVLRGLT